jgi:uncharacterized protein (DUF58 family)
MVTEICAVLAFSAIQNNDKIGVIFFSDQIEKFIPPKKGKSHILRIIRELIEFEPKHRKTNISEAVRFFSNVIKKRCTAFILSDFIDENFQDALKVANKKHDVVALQIYDKREAVLPKVGLIHFKDAETNEMLTVDTSDRKTRENYEQWWETKQEYIDNTFTRCGVDSVMISTDQDYVPPLMKLFKKRGHK